MELILRIRILFYCQTEVFCFVEIKGHWGHKESNSVNLTNALSHEG